MFKPFCYKIINNNIRAEPKLATSAATFLKWEEVYIVCFLQPETLELGDPCIRTLPLSRSVVRVGLVVLSSPSGALLSFAIWSVEGNLSAAVTICFLLQFISPRHPSLHPSFFIVSCLFALFVFPCLVPAPFQTRRPFSNVVPLSI